MSTPLLVATVFGATFLIVCVVAWALLGRGSSAAPAAGPPAPAPVSVPVPALLPQPSSSSAFDAPQAASFEIESIRSTGSVKGTSNRTTLRLYQALMFVTGATALLASYLMFTAVTEISMLLFVAVAAFFGGCLAIYRGVVPDPELTGKK